MNMNSNELLGLNALEARALHSQELATSSTSLHPKTPSPSPSLSPYKTYTYPKNLPIELWKIIIDYLAHDTQTLKACVLCCRSWGSLARVWLYERFIWEPGCVGSGSDADGEMKDMVIHPYPHLVRRLVIEGLNSNHESFPPPSTSPTTTPTTSTDWLLPLTLTLPLFTSTTHLELSSLNWPQTLSSTPWKTLSSSNTFTNRIKELYIVEMPIEPWSDVVSVVEVFRGLERLWFFPEDFDGVGFEGEFDDDDEDLMMIRPMPPPPSTLKFFSIEHSPEPLHAREFWKWFSPPPPPPPPLARALVPEPAVASESGDKQGQGVKLETLRLNDIPKEDIPYLKTYLRHIGDSLRCFRMRVRDFRDFDILMRSGILHENTGIEVLEIGGGGCGSGSGGEGGGGGSGRSSSSDWSPWYRGCVEFLRSVPVGGMRDLVFFDVGVDVGVGLDDHDEPKDEREEDERKEREREEEEEESSWRTLDELLSGTMFPELRVVRFRFRFEGCAGGLGVVKRKMWRCERRGLLCFDRE